MNCQWVYDIVKIGVLIFGQCVLEDKDYGCYDEQCCQYEGQFDQQVWYGVVLVGGMGQCGDVYDWVLRWWVVWNCSQFEMVSSINVNRSSISVMVVVF